MKEKEKNSEERLRGWEQSRVERVAEFLNKSAKKEGVHPKLMMIPAILAAESKQGYPKVIKSFLTTSDYAAVVSAFISLTIFEPTSSYKIIGHLLAILRDDTKAKGRLISPPFVIGSLLGMLEVAVWLDENWLTKTNFESALDEALIELLTLPYCSLELGYDALPNRKYEDVLSKTVANFIRAGKYNKPQRMASLKQILDKVYDIFESGRDPLPLQEFLADQIAYKYFSSLSTHGRYMALYLLNYELLNINTIRARLAGKK